MTRVHCTAPGHQGKSKVPFAAIPHAIAGDPRIAPVDKTLLLALIYWARDKDNCWPSDATLGARIGRSQATVQRGLKRLEALGLIRRVRAQNPTNRLIYLVWREGPAPALVRAPAPAPVRDERIVVVEGDALKEFDPHPQRPRCESAPQPAPPAPPCAPSQPQPPAPAVALTPQQQARLEEFSPLLRDKVLTWLALNDPITRAEAERYLRPAPVPRPAPRTTRELLERLPESPTYPAMAAQALALEWSDQKSWSAFHAVCTRAWRGELPVNVLLEAYRQASGPKARKPGAVLMHVVQREAGERRC